MEMEMFMESNLCNELKLHQPIAVIFTDDLPTDAKKYMPEKGKGSCSLHALNRVVAGESIYFSLETPTCTGMNFGFGFIDEIRIPGGFEYFLSCGKGPGFREGEMIKKTPEVALQFHAQMPKKVHNNKYIILKPLIEQDLDRAKLVILFANPDQLAALIHLYSYESAAHDAVFAAMCSGCGSLIRLPLAELNKERPRGVIGIVDIFARPHFDANLFALTVPAKKFREMEENSKNCFLQAHTWDGVRQRLKA
jgi:uncharacterized protein (DUF169 family)